MLSCFLPGSPLFTGGVSSSSSATFGLPEAKQEREKSGFFGWAKGAHGRGEILIPHVHSLGGNRVVQNIVIRNSIVYYSVIS